MLTTVRAAQEVGQSWGPSWGPFICKILLDRQKGPQKDPKKNHHIQEMCVLGDFEIHRKRCVGILSRRRQGRGMTPGMVSWRWGTSVEYVRDEFRVGAIKRRRSEDVHTDHSSKNVRSDKVRAGNINNKRENLSLTLGNEKE